MITKFHIFESFEESGSKFNRFDIAYPVKDRYNMKKDRKYKIAQIRHVKKTDQYFVKVLDSKAKKYIGKQDTSVRKYQIFTDYLTDNLENAAWLNQDYFLTDYEIIAKKYNL